MIIVLNSIKIRNLKLRLKSYFKSICNIANFELLSFRRSFIWYMTLTYRFTSSLFLWRLQIVNFSQISKTMFLEWWNLGRTRKHWYFLMKLGRLEQFLFFRDTRSRNIWKSERSLIGFCWFKLFLQFTFSVIVEQILSLGPEDPDAVEILENFTKFLRGLVSVPINLPGTPYAKAIQARHQIPEKVKKILRQRNNIENESNERMDFLDVLLSQENISEEEISILVLDLLLGG